MSRRVFLIAGGAALVLLPWEPPTPLFTVGGLFGVTLPELMIGLFCLLFVVTLRRWSIPRSGTAPAVAFVVILLASAALAPHYRSNSIKFAARMAAGFLFAGAVASMTREESGARVAGVAVTVSALVPAALGIVEWLYPAATQLGPFQHTPHLLGNLVRSQSVFPYPTIFSGFQEMALPFAMCSRAGPAAVILLSAGIFTTLSRASIAIASIIGLAFCVYGLRKRRFGIVSAGLAAPATMMVLFFALPSARQSLFVHDLGQWYSARLQLQRTEVIHYRDDIYIIWMRVSNRGKASWQREGKAQFYVSYWVAPGACAPVLRLSSPLPVDVAPLQETETFAYVHLPATCTEIKLAFDLITKNVTPFYAYGSPRLDVLFQKEGAQWRASPVRLDVSQFPEQDGGVIKPLPTRADLWRAALRMWASHPLLGVGPDNFRLLHGALLPERRTSEKIFSNNLFLELLSGTGLLGFCAFLWMLLAGSRHITMIVVNSGVRPGDAVSALRERTTRLSLSAAFCIAVFCLHGLVDCMILFSPIYGLFWAAYGMLFASGWVEPHTGV